MRQVTPAFGGQDLTQLIYQFLLVDFKFNFYKIIIMNEWIIYISKIIMYSVGLCFLNFTRRTMFRFITNDWEEFANHLSMVFYKDIKINIMIITIFSLFCLSYKLITDTFLF